MDARFRTAFHFHRWSFVFIIHDIKLSWIGRLSNERNKYPRKKNQQKQEKNNNQRMEPNGTLWIIVPCSQDLRTFFFPLSQKSTKMFSLSEWLLIRFNLITNFMQFSLIRRRKWAPHPIWCSMIVMICFRPTNCNKLM